MAGFLNDTDAVERILQHISAGTTDASDEVWREPVENYRSPERLEREIAEVFRRVPVPFCPSAALPDIGSYIARDHAGIPLLIVRGRDRVVRGFKNACRHRGTPVAEDSGCAKAFVCPYHAWTYGLDGKLQGLPHEGGFPGLDKATHGLEPISVDEKLGLVFVSLDKNPPAASGTDDLPLLVSPEQQFIAYRESVVQANWKIFLEGFLEGYHIRFAHPETFYPYGFDNLTLLETCGAHSRITFPFRRIEKLRELPPEERSVDGRLTYVYHLFPNVVITVLSRHTNVLILEPFGIDQTKQFTYQLTNRGADAHDTALAKRDSGFVNDTGAVEDIQLVTSIQRNLGSGANDVFTFGHYESLIAHLHRNLSNALD
jgi:phenylpropionate dioxygenase-like ring-hydroxylating dioxygenase large terminal subunit